MNSSAPLRIRLQTNPEQHERLLALQAAFVQACNALAPVVQQNRCWHRVTLHHLTYKTLRERFPGLGSQMACNAIYSVCRTARVVFQHPESPANVSRLNGGPLPLIQFAANSPVYFDRHTLSIRGGTLSMFTLDGRMVFEVALPIEGEMRFHREKLREIVLSRNAEGAFELCFWFAPDPDAAGQAGGRVEAVHPGSLLPDYVRVESHP
jgi:hypothetical protein